MKIQSDQEVQNDDRKNPVKRAEREKEFRTIGKFKEIFTDANQIYLNVLNYAKTFKSVRNQHIRNKELQVVDFSLAARGPQEDQIYSTSPFYRNNIRRGNTVVVNSKTKEALWGRKGLMKFFDISERTLEAIKAENIKSLNKKDLPIYYAIFGDIQNALSCNDQLQEANKAKVHVYRLNKANGQNAQVSYFPLTDDWVISSKNVSIFVKDPAELKQYKEERYQFALLMAETWFKLISTKTKEDIQKLKNDLAGRTIIGEYCGNPEFQHLVKYSQITIYFYAMVQNASALSCLPPNKTFAFLEKYQLPIVKNYQKSYFGHFSNYVDFGEALIRLFHQVSTSSIFQDEQGSVLYFVLEKPKVFCQFISDRYLQAQVPIPEDWQKHETNLSVCSLGKLKTLEYRILRKLREKLKYITRVKKGGQVNNQKAQNDQKKLEQKYGSFERQVYQLVKDKQLSKPIEYFFCAAILAFEYAFKQRKSPRNLKLITQHYLDFASVIFWCMQNKKQVSVHLMQDEQLHKELRQTTWREYSSEIVKSYDELLQKLAPKYYKIKKSMSLKEMVEEEAQKDIE